MSTAPTISSIAFSPNPANVGQVVTATVTYVPGTSAHTYTFTDVATDTATNVASAPVSGSFTVNNVNDPTNHTPSDTGSHTWTKTSDSGTVATFTTTV